MKLTSAAVGRSERHLKIQTIMAGAGAGVGTGTGTGTGTGAGVGTGSGLGSGLGSRIGSEGQGRKDGWKQAQGQGQGQRQGHGVCVLSGRSEVLDRALSASEKALLSNTAFLAQSRARRISG
jgi:hypothetical protein